MMGCLFSKWLTKPINWMQVVKPATSSAHAIVIDPEQSRESGMWTFKNSYGDGLFRVTDGLMQELVANDQLLLYQ